MKKIYNIFEYFERKEKYKMKSLSKKALLLTAVVGTGFLFGSNQVHVHVATATSITTSKVKSPIENTPLTKDGYIVRVLDNKNADKVYVGKANYNRLVKSSTPLKRAKTITPKKIQNIKFRIEKVLNVSKRVAGAPVYLVASKDKKYSTWTTQSGLQYYYLNSKSMAGVTKPLKRIANRQNRDLKKANNKRDFNQAMKAAKKLKGSQRSFVLRSLKQLQKDGMNDEGVNLLLFGLQ